MSSSVNTLPKVGSRLRVKEGHLTKKAALELSVLNNILQTHKSDGAVILSG